jgi:hypothetical protein
MTEGFPMEDEVPLRDVISNNATVVLWCDTGMAAPAPPPPAPAPAAPASAPQTQAGGMGPPPPPLPPPPPPPPPVVALVRLPPPAVTPVPVAVPPLILLRVIDLPRLEAPTPPLSGAPLAVRMEGQDDDYRLCILDQGGPPALGPTRA